MTSEPAMVAELITGVIAGDSTSQDRLRRIVEPGIRVVLSRRIAAEDVETAVDEVISSMLDAIRQGSIGDVAGLPAHVRTIIVRIAAQVNAKHVRAVPRTRAESRESSHSRRGSEKLLNKLTIDELEIVERFYAREQTVQQICSEMHITEAQFRSAKCEAKRKLHRSIPASAGRASRTVWQRVTGCVA